jgi:hypothetical protein
MPFDDEDQGELDRVRKACEDLGADEEMTDLLLASHRYDRTPLDVVVRDGGGLRDYVLQELAVWAAIFDEK